MKKKDSSTKARSTNKRDNTKIKDWEDIMDDLFHQLSSSVVSLEGYAAILTNEYGRKLDRKGKYYVRRIHKNTRDMERAIRILRECIARNGKT